MAPIRTVRVPFEWTNKVRIHKNHSNGRVSFALSPQRHPMCTSASLLTRNSTASRFHSCRPVLTHTPAVGLAVWNRQTIKAHEIVGSSLDPAARVTNTILTVKELLSPLSREDLKIVRCLGLNYSDHAVCPFLHPPLFVDLQPCPGRDQDGKACVSAFFCRFMIVESSGAYIAGFNSFL